jgi:hypothetical protein
MDIKTENAIAPLITRWQQRDDELDQSIIEWAGRNLSPVQANELIGIVRNSLSAINAKTELTTLAASLAENTLAEVKTAAASPDVMLHLAPAEVIAIVRGMDRWPAAETPPDGWWTLQEKLKQAMAANPQAAEVVNGELDGR